jgi:hypothetical protein
VTTPHRHNIAKLAPTSLNPSIAEVPAPALTTGQAEKRIEISTYLTRAGGTEVLYQGDRMWAKVTLTLLTAGPVSVGQQAQLAPVLSGKGQLLATGVPTPFNVPKGNRLYIIATGINPVTVIIEAYPWLETITGLAGAAASAAHSVARGGQLGLPPQASPIARRSTGKAG